MRRVSIRFWLAFAIAAALVAIAVAAAPFVRHFWSRRVYAQRLGVARVISASRALSYRHALARLTPAFDYRPFRRVERGSISGGEAELLESVARFARMNTQSDDTATLQGAGVALLTAGADREACLLLERALWKASGESNLSLALARTNDARLLSDLAAAYYERGVANDDAESILSAIDAATRAWQLDPQLNVAAFNRALAIERMHTPEQAIAAWNDYLHLDDDAGWRDEARERIAALESQRRETPSKIDAASRIQNELLPSWGSAFLRGDNATAQSSLNEATAGAHHLVSCCGDDFYERAVDSLTRTSGQRATILATAYEKYREGYDLYRADETSKSIQSFEASRNALVSLDDVFAVKPWSLAAVSYAFIGDHERALRETDAALAYCQARPGCSSTARADLLWNRGLIYGRLGDIQRANAEFSEAVREFESAHDVGNAASVDALFAGNLVFLGASGDAWPHLTPAMHVASASGLMRRIYIAYTVASDAARSGKHWTSARMFEDVIIESERRERNFVLLADSLLTRGQILLNVSPVEARRDFAEARRIAATIPDPGRRAKVLATAALSEAGAIDPQDAAKLLTDALQYFDSVKDHYHLAEIYSQRAEAAGKMRMQQAAEDDFRRCIGELELERESIASADLRVASFTRSSDVFDRVIDHLWLSGRRDDAFGMAEESRGREFIHAQHRSPLRLADVAKSLRSDEVLIEYALLPNRMLTWVIDARGRVTWIDAPVKEQDVQSAVNRLRDDFDEAIERLSALVWNSMSDATRAAKRIVIVPNKALRAVPFAALRDRASAHFLIEDHEILVAPSATAYFQSVSRDAQSHQRTAPVAIMTSTGGDESRRLPRLEAGAGEAAAVRDIYGDRAVIDAAATPERFIARTRGAAVVHVIAHAVSNAEHPEVSSIVLDAGNQGRDLYARTIEAASWPATRVVFLSTCGTAEPATYNDAPLTLPESFVAAGVPVVIASMTAVNDARASDFAVAFHRHFAQSGDAVNALRAAQLEFLHADRNDTKTWSSWIAIGGTS